MNSSHPTVKVSSDNINMYIRVGYPLNSFYNFQESISSYIETLKPLELDKIVRFVSSGESKFVHEMDSLSDTWFELRIVNDEKIELRCTTRINEFERISGSQFEPEPNSMLIKRLITSAPVFAVDRGVKNA